ncbi:hypothetical protein J2X31_001644 [Flavobacterium arsenatis]|uniref:TIGR04255 family protein n=1 Tax=Flavobacterium arsenatis TaxID=1484332 RepID=A0ABU1TPB3_9FLAO|nr:hypothetical protein [Flavobacterium arsenatis]MDR6967632.1 hypothetical protein [Flavobacterium arsenatis]
MKKDFLRPVDVKLERAKVQIDEIFLLVEKSVADNRIKFSCNEFENKLGYYLYVGDYTEDNFFEELSVRVGEFIHNLRSILDNLVYALARVHNDPPKNPRKLSFPICENREIFDRSTIDILEQIPLPARETILSAQPFMFGNLPGFKSESYVLSIITYLNNADKHRIPASFIAVFDELYINGKIYFDEDDYVEINETQKFKIQLPVTPKLKFFEFHTEDFIYQIDLEFKLSYNIAIEVFDEILHIDYLKNLLRSTEILVRHFRNNFE